MTRKNIIIRILFFLALTALTAAALYCGTPLRRRYSARGLHISLPAAKAEKAAKIVIRWRDVHTTLMLKDGRWVVEERGSRPASVPRISALLNSLSALAPVKQLHNVDQETLRQLRLVENDPKLIPGVRLILYDRANRELFSILLGKGHFVRPEPGRTSSGEAEGRYVLVNGKVYLIPVVFENCHPVPAVWVEPLRLYELRRSLMMTSQRFENGKGRLLWSVFRKSTAHPFTLAYPIGKMAENQLLSGLAERLSNPFTMDYYIPGKDGKDPVFQHKLTIRSADGFSYELSVADGPDEYDIVSLKIEYDEKRVLRMPGETDDQFKKRCRALRQRFDFERGYSHGLFFKTKKKELSRMLEIVPEKIR